MKDRWDPRLRGCGGAGRVAAGPEATAERIEAAVAKAGYRARVKGPASRG